jgi:hypothetical protein
MVMRFGPGLDHWPVPSLSGMHTDRSKRSHSHLTPSARRHSEPALIPAQNQLA